MSRFTSRQVWLVAGIALLSVAIPVRAGESERGRELRQKMSEIVDYAGIEDPRATLSDALDMLSKRYNLTIDLNEKAFEMDQLKDVGKMPVAEKSPIPAMRTSLEKVLRRILRVVPTPSGATYLIRGDAIEITTVAAIRKEFFADRPEMKGPLPPLVSSTFDKVPLEAALKELNRYDNVALDPRMAQEAQALVTADFSNVPLDTAVRLFADMAGLKVVRMGNVLYVTSEDNARALEKEQKKLRSKHKNEKKKSEKEKNPAAKPASVPAKSA
ncbi:MAG: hypothetical protein ACYC3I_15195 [Gemmataceae bacterium]